MIPLRTPKKKHNIQAIGITKGKINLQRFYLGNGSKCFYENKTLTRVNKTVMELVLADNTPFQEQYITHRNRCHNNQQEFQIKRSINDFKSNAVVTQFMKQTYNT